MKNFVQYGAGNIGRGFIGQLFSQGGYDVRFIDVNMDVVNALNRDHKYTVTIVDGDDREDVIVHNVSAIDGREPANVAEAIAEADAMATAIGVNILPRIAGNIAEGIRLRYERKIKSPLDIIICENLLDADKFLHKLISDELNEGEREYFNSHIGLVEASIGRMVPVMTQEQLQDDPLKVYVEKYCELPVDKDAFKGSVPEIPGIYPFSPFGLYIKRKLFIHNMGHALSAYLGNLQGADYVWQAMAVPEIKLIVYRAMLESATALSRQYSFPLESLIDHINDLLRRFANKALGDTTSRVGNDVKRKLSPDDRFAGAIRFCEGNSITPAFIPAGIAAALFFRNENDRNSVQLFAELDEKGVDHILENFCGINGDRIVVDMIRGYYSLLKENGDISALLALAENNYAGLNAGRRII